jgi:hypothetical protein
MEESESRDRREEFRLTLYTAGDDEKTEQLAECIRRWCADQSIPLTLVIVDVLDQLDRAIRDRVFATPMLVRHSPPPEGRVIGNLSVTAEVMRLLQIPPADCPTPMAVPDPGEPVSRL